MRMFIRFFIVLLVALFPLFGSTAPAQFVIHLIDVGQADAILVEFKSAAILIDAGGESTDDDRYKHHLKSALDEFFAKRADLKNTFQAIIVTHPHIDHTRLLMDVFENFKVTRFYDGGDDRGSGAPQLKKARAYASDHKIEYSAIEDKAIGKDGFTPAGLKKISSGTDVRFLTGSRGCANANNNSLVVRVQYEGKTALLTGDSETDDDEDCEEGQVEHLLERYQGTDLLRADVYKVGHHASHNGTDEAFITAVSPAIAIISAGRKETKGPGPFHGFFFGHPREDVVELLEATTGNRNPPVMGYTYLKGTKNKDATDTILEGRLIPKAIYCTCWDGDVAVDLDKANGEFAVDASDRRPINHGGQLALMTVAKPNPQPSTQPLRFGSLPSTAETGLSIRQMFLLFAILIVVYVTVRVFEASRDWLRKQKATNLIKKLKGGWWEFNRFELGAWIERSDSKDLKDPGSGTSPKDWWIALVHFLLRPRMSIDEVVEQAVGEVIASPAYGSVSQREDLIDQLRGLHSHPKNPRNLSGALPSTRFFVAAAIMIVLMFAIQAVPPVGGYIAGIFGHDSFLEELWTGVLAGLAGTGATFLRRRSGQGHADEKRSTITQDTPETRKQEAKPKGGPGEKS